MNTTMIRHLVAKDWGFHQRAIAIGAGAGLAALGLLLSPGEGMFYAGTVLLITVVISIGIFLAFLTVINERTEGTLPFVMSIPIGVREYTAAKLVANYSLFLLPWAALTIGAVAVVLARDAVPDGLAPYAVILLLYILTGYTLTLGTALVTESQGWTIGVMGACNLGLQGFMYWTSHLPDIAATLQGPVAVWTSSIRWLIAAELLINVLAVCITWILQSRKTDFT